MAEPVLYGPAYSSYVRTAQIAMIEKGVGHKLVAVNTLAGETRGPEHLARQPFGKVPAFAHDGFALYETAAIVTYVDRAFDGPALFPADPKGAARVVQVIGVNDAYLYPAAIGDVVINKLVAPMLGREPDAAAIERGMKNAAKALAALEDLAQGDGALVGGGFTAADAFLVPVFAYMEMAGVADEPLAGRPKLAAWWAGIKSRPSVEATAPKLG